MNIIKEQLENNPDVKYVSLPIIDKTGKTINSVSNKDLVLNNYGLINNIDSNKIGTEITINQIRDVISFTQLSAHKDKKIVILNDVSKMNIEASSALLKTLEEVTSNCSFILICNSVKDVHETIKSRCLHINIDSYVHDNSQNFEEFFFLRHSFLKDNDNIYDITTSLNETVDQINGLLDKSYDPIDVAIIWNKLGIKLIIEIVNMYIIYILKRYISTDLKTIESKCHIKKLSNIYEIIPNIKKNILMNINPKYLLNNLSIELAS
jgi:DNA polymerase III gamma/tau subunit